MVFNHTAPPLQLAGLYILELFPIEKRQDARPAVSGDGLVFI